jgi:hypothetical protein
MLSDVPVDGVDEHITSISDTGGDAVREVSAQPESVDGSPTSRSEPAELPDAPPIPPPRRESQFKDAVSALERAKAARVDTSVEAARQGRDLSEQEKRAVAEKRAMWQSSSSTAQRSTESHVTDPIEHARRQRELNEAEKRRVAATRFALRSSPRV